MDRAAFEAEFKFKIGQLLVRRNELAGYLQELRLRSYTHLNLMPFVPFELEMNCCPEGGIQKLYLFYGYRASGQIICRAQEIELVTWEDAQAEIAKVKAESETRG